MLATATACVNSNNELPKRELLSIVRAVPTPAGLKLSGESTNRNLDVSTGLSYNQATREYLSTVSCPVLARAWTRVLQQAGRQFREVRDSNLLWRIFITDTPAIVAINLGAPDCTTAFVFAFRRP